MHLSDVLFEIKVKAFLAEAKYLNKPYCCLLFRMFDHVTLGCGNLCCQSYPWCCSSFC